MKKILLTSAALCCFMAVTAAFADGGGASLYKSQCQSCHGVDGSREPAKGVTPVKGMSPTDIETRLQGYKDGTFGGQQKQIMRGIVNKLSEEQMKSVAEYIGTL